MTKLSKKLLLVVLALTLVLTLSLAACKENATVSFVGGDGATGTAPDAINTTVGETIQLPENTFTKQGYVFAGWKNGDKVLQPKAMYIVESASVQFVAQWTAEEQPVVTLTSITATYYGTVTVNGLMNPQSLVVMGHYSDGHSDTVTGYIIGDLDVATAGNKQVEISYTEGGVTKTCNVTIEVVTAAPTTYALAYAAGEHGTGTAPAAEQKEAGAKVTLAAATLFTAASGYEFDGWSDGTTKYAAGAEFTMPANAVTLTAQWKVIKHTVTFDPNNEGATWTAEVNHGETVAKPATDPVHPDGKTFRYWKSEGGSEYNFATPVTGDLDLTAEYAYKVTYLAGTGATGAVPEAQWVKTWTQGTLTSLPAGTGLSNGNKIFAGWSDGTDVYQPGEAYTSVENYYTLKNVTFTAVWQDSQAGENQWTVTFKGDEGMDDKAVTVDDGQTVTVPSFTHPQGKVAIEWKNGNAVFDFSTPITANITLTATWKYCVTLVGGEGATGEMEPLYTGYQVKAPACGFTKEGYTFKCWTDGVKTYNVDDYIKETSVTLTAVWEENVVTTQYYVTWVKATNDSLVDSVVGNLPEAQQIAAGSKITAPAANTLTLAHYTFNSWRVYEYVVDTDGTGRWQGMLDDNNKAVTIAPGADYIPTKTVQIRAHWDANTITISFDANEGTGAMASIQKSAGSPLGYTTISCAFTAPDGMVFAGWALSADGAVLEQDPKLSAIASEQDTVTLYAIWKSATPAPETPLIDQITGAWTTAGHTLDVVAGQSESNPFIKGYAILDGKYLLAIIDNDGVYGACSFDYDLYYGMTLSNGTLTLTPTEGSAIALTGKTELTNAAHSTFEGKWANATGQPWIITASEVYYGADLLEASLGVVIGNNIALVYEASYYNYIYVLAKQGDNLEGWYDVAEKAPQPATFVAGDYLTLIVDGELNQIVNSGSAPDASKITAPKAPDGQVFVKWVVAGTETEFDPTVAMTESVAIVAVFEEGLPASAKTYVGSVTIKGILDVQYTFTKFVIDFEALTITGNPTSGDVAQITMTNAQHPDWKPDTYGDSAAYYDVTIKVGLNTLNTHFVVNADQTKLTVCNDGDEPLPNGELVLQQAGAVSWKTLSATDANGDLYKLAKDDNVRLYFAEPFENGGVKFLGIEFNVHSVYGVRIKGVYESDGTETVPGTYLSNPTQSTENIAWLVYHSNAYDIVIGEKDDGNFYIVSFKYGSANTEYDTTERVLAAKAE